MRKALKILMAADFVQNLGAGMLGPIYAIFVEQIGGNILDAGIAWAIYSAAIGISIFIFSRFEDKMSKEKLIVAGYGLTTIGFLGYYFVSTTIHLFIIQLYLGLVVAFMDPAWCAFFTRKVDKGKEAREWGDWEAGKYIFVAIAAVIGGYLAFNFGFKFLFIVMAGVSAISTIIAFMLLREK